MPHMNLIGYLRVSTLPQVTETLGFETQKFLIEEYCTRHAHHIIATVKETESGGKGTEQRHRLEYAISLIEAGTADGIIVARMDRLARDLLVQEAVLAKVWKHGGHVYTAEYGRIQEDDPADPMRTAMRKMMGLFNELERGMIRARLVSGSQAKKARGGYSAGAPPFGWRAEGGELVEDEAEAKIVEEICYLRRAGTSINRIAARLTAQGCPTKRGSTTWTPTAVSRVLQSIDKFEKAEAS